MTTMESLPVAAGPSTEAITSAPAMTTTTTALYDDEGRHMAMLALSTFKSCAPTATAPPLLPTPSTPTFSSEIGSAKSETTSFSEHCHGTNTCGVHSRTSWLRSRGNGKETLPNADTAATPAASQRPEKKSLRLLDLPIDILTEIVAEVTHTNDLTSLALCHSALHRLAIPHIYSRFDIVWPDTSTHSEPRAGVDALTYGLATLVMAEEVFGEALGQQSNALRATETTIRRRRGNHYAHYTRKFSLGNGPPDWVQEYLITKEGGKMLGTLVALAVARMHSLETFVWDMPTGILRDVWLALASLAERADAHPCRLEKVWVRWHNNSSPDTSTSSLPPPPQLFNNNGILSVPPQPTHMPSSTNLHHTSPLDRVERPSFSVLSPLKSLSVLDIDELAYLDEMAVLISKSLSKLRELRVGIARHALDREWVTVWEGGDLRQVDKRFPTAAALTLGEKRLGGVLGVLAGFVCDIRTPTVVPSDDAKYQDWNGKMTVSTRQAEPDSPPQLDRKGEAGTEELSHEQIDYDGGVDTHAAPLLISSADVLPSITPSGLLRPSEPDLERLKSTDQRHSNEKPTMVPHHLHTPVQNDKPSNPAKLEILCSLDSILQLDSLELERVPISVPVLQKSIDWTRLTSLTLLSCPNHEQLWKTLRRAFAPTPKSPIYPIGRRSNLTYSTKKGGGRHGVADAELMYTLRLRKIHTNTVSPALISFLRETLAPNSLHTLFLQETRFYASPVSLEAIFKGPLRRHRLSLRKLLIDSSEKAGDGALPLPAMGHHGHGHGHGHVHGQGSGRWRRWMLTREVLAFFCSGRMPELRELGGAIEYRDWHFFVQNLTSIPHLRSLYLSFIADHVHGPTGVDPRDLALQIVNAVYFRPEIEICYVGIAGKCFEILEGGGATGHGECDGRLWGRAGLGGDVDNDDDENDEDEGADGDVEDGEDDELDEEDEDAAGTESDEDDQDDDEGEESDDDVNSEIGSADVHGDVDSRRPRLREILFYDDKVAIFKARHGRL